jgi:hypothetical protein
VSWTYTPERASSPAGPRAAAGGLSTADASPAPSLGAAQFVRVLVHSVRRRLFTRAPLPALLRRPRAPPALLLRSMLDVGSIDPALCSVLFDPSSTQLRPTLYSVLFDPSSTPALLLRSKPLLRPHALLRRGFILFSSRSTPGHLQLSTLYHAKSTQHDSRSGPEARACCRSNPGLQIRPTSCSRSDSTTLSRPRSSPTAHSARISYSGPDPRRAASSPRRLLHP